MPVPVPSLTIRTPVAADLFPFTRNSSGITDSNATLTSLAGAAAALVTPASIGLGNVNNTSDANKPVSTAQQTALNLKADASAVTTALGLKADASAVTTSLALKQDRAPAVQTVASAATVTPTFSDDMVRITAQAVGLTLANPTGTAVEGYGMTIRIKDDGTARTIAFGSNYRALGVTLPTTTAADKLMYINMIYNTTDTKWDVLAVGQEA